jgi:hypothetical protein
LYSSPTFLFDQIKKLDGRACSMHGRNGKFIQNCSWGNLKGRDSLGDLGIDGRMPIK